MQAALQNMEAAPFEESSEFNALFNDIDAIITEDMLGNLDMVSVQKTIRSRGGNERQLTHWTRDEWSSESHERFMEELEDVLPYHLGSGSFANVFDCPWDDTKAIKIGTGHAYDGEVGVDGWLEYAAWCIENPNPRVIPVIHNLMISDCFYVALLDKYDMTVSEADWQLGTRDLEIVHKRMETLKAVLQMDEEFDPEEHDEEYYAIAKELAEKSLSVNDGHDENFMVRRDTLDVILTDPSSEECSNAAWELLGTLGIRRA